MATFPTSVPNRTGTPLGLMTASNVRPGKLSAALAAGGTTVQVDFDPVAAGYPTSGYLVISRAGAPREVVKYGGRASTGGNPGSFTGLTRAQDGTTDQAHLQGDDISMALFAGVVNSLADELIAGLTKIGAGLTTPSTSGHVLQSTGGGGSAWSYLNTLYVPAPYCTVKTLSTTTQTFTSNGLSVALTYDAEAADTYGMFPGSGTYTGAIRLAYSGLWDFNASVIFNVSGLTGPVEAAFYNETAGVWFGGDKRYFSNSTNPSMSLVGKMPFSANDEIRVYIVNNSGTSLTTYSGGAAGPTFTATLVGPS